jgi:hypothetical protein
LSSQYPEEYNVDMKEQIDLNKLRDERLRGDKKPEDVLPKPKRYEEYLKMPPEELTKIADENNQTPEEFLNSIKLLESLRRSTPDPESE